MLDDGDFASIARFVTQQIDNQIGRRRDYFFIAKVLKNDKDNNLIWVKELGDQPIPLLAFNYDVDYFDETPRGVLTTSVGTAAKFKTTKKKARVKVQCPKKGETVLIAREMGSDFLPRCLGVIQSKKYLDLEDW